MRGHRGPARPTGFTLVELLVVLSIIALLISILLPALRRARDQGKEVVCLTRFHQIGHFGSMYQIENGGYFARSEHSAIRRRVLPWGRAYFLYATGEPWSFETSQGSFLSVLNTDFRCPFDPGRAEASPYPNFPPVTPWSYAINVYFELSEREIDPAKPGADDDMIVWAIADRTPRPGATVRMGEMTGGDALMGGSTADHMMAHFWSARNATPEVDQDRHRPGEAYLFVDGHAESLRFARTYDSANKRNNWNPADAW